MFWLCFLVLAALLDENVANLFAMLQLFDGAIHIPALYANIYSLLSVLVYLFDLSYAISQCFKGY